MTDHLFVYGTLRPGHAPDEVADIVDTLQPIGKGTIKGTRYDLGDFPAVPRVERHSGRVQGEVFALPDSPEALARLDQYEEYDPKHPGQSLFRRVRVPVTLQDGTRKTCWVYLYNRAIPKEAVTQAGLIRRVNKASNAANSAR